MKYARLFALLMRMRQTCCHPFLVLGKGSKKATQTLDAGVGVGAGAGIGAGVGAGLRGERDRETGRCKGRSCARVCVCVCVCVSNSLRPVLLLLHSCLLVRDDTTSHYEMRRDEK